MLHIQLSSFAGGAVHPAVQGVKLGICDDGVFGAGQQYALGGITGFLQGSGDPATEGIALRSAAGMLGHGDGIPCPGSIRSYSGAILIIGHGRRGSRSKVDANSAIRSGVHPEYIAVLRHFGGAGDHSEAGGHVAISGRCGDGGAGNHYRAKVSVVHGNRDLVTILAALTGGSGHIGGDCTVEHQVSQFGIVNEDIAGTGDGFHRIVAAQLPGINGVLFHPFEEHFLAFHNAAAAPHITGVAPADIVIQHQTGHVTMDIVLAVGIIVGVEEAAGFTVGSIAAAGVFLLGGRTQSHNIRRVILLALVDTLTSGPAVFPIPGVAAIPIRADFSAGVEGRNGTSGISSLAIGVAVLISGFIIRGNMIMITYHQILKFAIQWAAGNLILIGRTGILGQKLIGGIVILVEILGLFRQVCRGHAAVSPVGNVVGCVCLQCHAGQQAQAQNNYQHKGYTALGEIFHNHSPFLYKIAYAWYSTLYNSIFRRQ